MTLRGASCVMGKSYGCLDPPKADGMSCPQRNIWLVGAGLLLQSNLPWGHELRSARHITLEMHRPRYAMAGCAGLFSVSAALAQKRRHHECRRVSSCGRRDVVFRGPAKPRFVALDGRNASPEQFQRALTVGLKPWSAFEVRVNVALQYGLAPRLS